MKLDLAAGQKCKEGFEGVDLVACPGIRHVVDLFQVPWPFERASVTEIHCSHFVEHTPDLIAFMEEVYRILVPAGTIRIVSPYYTSIRCWQDPTHTRAITDATWAYFNKAWREREGLSHYPITCDFDLTHIEHAIHPFWAKQPLDAIKHAMSHYWNVIEDMTVVLTKR